MEVSRFQSRRAGGLYRGRTVIGKAAMRSEERDLASSDVVEAPQDFHLSVRDALGDDRPGLFQAPDIWPDVLGQWPRRADPPPALSRPDQSTGGSRRSAW